MLGTLRVVRRPWKFALRQKASRRKISEYQLFLRDHAHFNGRRTVRLLHIQLLKASLTTRTRQLAVVDGLVYNRIQELKRGTPAIEARCAPVSYGVICDMPYVQATHTGEDVVEDPVTRRRMAINQIRWLILQVLKIVSVPNASSCFTKSYREPRCQFLGLKGPSNDLSFLAARGAVGRWISG